uniref:Uncharacterized protein n=1 Tax=Cucumis melo TaxID=3656 RepID=A0A9I9E5S7_CUCME
MLVAGYLVLLSVRNCFIRGSVVRYVQLPPDGVDIELLHDATRREARAGNSETKGWGLHNDQNLNIALSILRECSGLEGPQPREF